MRCSKCGRSFDDKQRRCPHCGQPAGERTAAVLKTSTILISADDTEGVYHSVEEVPEPLRKKLLRSTNSINSRTILIADRRGRREILRAMKNLPGAAQRRLSTSLLSASQPSHTRLTIPQIAGILLAAATGVVTWLILSHHW